MPGFCARSDKIVSWEDGSVSRRLVIVIRRLPPFFKGKGKVRVEPRKRKPRADAAKNREKLIAAAKEVLGQGGPNASLEAVAAKLATACGKSQTYTGTYYHKVSGDMQVPSSGT